MRDELGIEASRDLSVPNLLALRASLAEDDGLPERSRMSLEWPQRCCTCRRRSRARTRLYCLRSLARCVARLVSCMISHETCRVCAGASNRNIGYIGELIELGVCMINDTKHQNARLLCGSHVAVA